MLVHHGFMLDTTERLLLRRREVEALIGFAKSQIYAMIAEGRFPSPVRIGTKAVRWRAADVQGWIDSLPSAR